MLIKRKNKLVGVCGNLEDLASMVTQIIIEYGDKMNKLLIDSEEDCICFETIEVKD